MKPVEGDHESANAGRLTKEAALGECILLQQAILERSHSVLHLLIVTVKRTKIEVRRADKLRVISVIGAKDVMDDDGGKVEQMRGNLCGMFPRKSISA